MKPYVVIDQYWQWVNIPVRPLQMIEGAGRTCYKSEHKITSESAQKFVSMILKRGHESVIEHMSASVLFVTNRGVTHELVRHRIAAYSQESTRYVNYKNRGMIFIKPVWWDKASEKSKDIWAKSAQQDVINYEDLLYEGWRPEEARDVLPNCLKTEIVTTFNLRQWRHVFKQRCSKAAHPQMRALMRDCLKGFQKYIPILFDDIEVD